MLLVAWLPPLPPAVGLALLPAPLSMLPSPSSLQGLGRLSGASSAAPAHFMPPIQLPTLLGEALPAVGASGKLLQPVAALRVGAALQPLAALSSAAAAPAGAVAVGPFLVVCLP